MALKNRIAELHTTYSSYSKQLVWDHVMLSVLSGPLGLSAIGCLCQEQPQNSSVRSPVSKWTKCSCDALHICQPPQRCVGCEGFVKHQAMVVARIYFWGPYINYIYIYSREPKLHQFPDSSVRQGNGPMRPGHSRVISKSQLQCVLHILKWSKIVNCACLSRFGDVLHHKAEK